MSAIKPGKRKRAPLKAAAVTYAVIVASGLTAAGAHALWSQSGTLRAGVTAGTWAPNPVPASSVTCTWVSAGDKTQVTFRWAATDASSYTVGVEGSSVPAPVKTASTSATLSLHRPVLWDSDVHTVTITPEASGLTATPTRIRVELNTGLLGTNVTCGPR